jgi:hypothetical protein
MDGPKHKVSWRGHNCTGKFEATRQIPGLQSSTKHIIHSSTTTIVRILLSLVCSFVNSRYTEISKCRTLSVTGRVRVICLRGASKVCTSIFHSCPAVREIVTFVEHGHVKIATFLIPYHVGDIVDIKANASQQKGMPHKFYHGSVLVTFRILRPLMCSTDGPELCIMSPPTPLVLSLTR